MSEGVVTSSPLRASVYQAFYRLCKSISGAPSLIFGDRIKSVHNNGLAGLNVISGDLIRVQCSNYDNMSAQSPIINQANLDQQFSIPDTTVGPLFCRVVTSFSRTTVDGRQEYWAAVYP